MSTKATLLACRASAGMSKKGQTISSPRERGDAHGDRTSFSQPPAADPTPEEVFGVTTVISVPNLGTNTVV